MPRKQDEGPERASARGPEKTSAHDDQRPVESVSQEDGRVPQPSGARHSVLGAIDAMGGLESAEWQWFLVGVVHSILNHARPTVLRVPRRVYDVPDQRLKFDLEYDVGQALSRAADVAAVVGYALAKTWPTQLEDFDAWGERALGHADLSGMLKIVDEYY